MSPEELKLLEKTYALTKENNEMLSAMRRTLFLGRLMKIIYWSVIIIVSGFAIKALQPYLDQIRGISEGVSNISSQGSSSYSDLIRSLIN